MDAERNRGHLGVRERRTLLLILLMAFLLRLGMALWSPNLLYPDEIFQTREPAHRLAFGYGVTSWEWREGVRSWVFPAVLAGIMQATAWMGPGSYGYITGIAAFLALISLSAVWLAYAWGMRVAGKQAAVVAAVTAAVWYELIYYGPKAMYEVVAAHLLLPGVYFAAFSDIAPRKRAWIAGLFFGAAVALRIQLVPAVLVAVALFYWRRPRWEWWRVVAGMAVPVLIVGAVDWITWSYPFQSFVKYVAVNVLDGRSAQYGVQPWYWYANLLKYSGPIVALALVAWRRTWQLLIIAAVVVATHSLLGHKEYRFIFPALPLLTAAAGVGLWTATRYVRRARADVWFVVVLIAFVSHLWNEWVWDAWEYDRGYLVSAQWLSRQKDVCGMAAVVDWGGNGGYTYLHRNVPIYPIANNARLPDGSQPPEGAYNYLVQPESKRVGEGWTKLRCRRSICVYRREGSCTADPRHEVNAVLRETGQ